jgi:GNAT superfamily N-acetyltransferase
MTLVVREAGADDAVEVAAILADAFVDDPVMRWVCPDPATRPSRLAALFDGLGRGYLDVGGCRLVEDHAATLWMPPGRAMTDEFRAELGPFLARALQEDAERLQVVAALARDAHPHDEHWYLQSVGVRPSSQGRGLGATIIGVTLDEADAAGVPCYLEASSPRSRSLYERLGFAVTGELVVPDGPSMWAMWRTPC